MNYTNAYLDLVVAESVEKNGDNIWVLDNYSPDKDKFIDFPSPWYLTQIRNPNILMMNYAGEQTDTERIRGGLLEILENERESIKNDCFAEIDENFGLNDTRHDRRRSVPVLGISKKTLDIGINVGVATISVGLMYAFALDSSLASKLVGFGASTGVFLYNFRDFTKNSIGYLKFESGLVKSDLRKARSDFAIDSEYNTLMNNIKNASIEFGYDAD